MNDVNSVEPRIILMRLIPGFIQLETELVLHTSSWGEPYPSTKSEIDALSKKTFGTIEGDVRRYVYQLDSDQARVSSALETIKLRGEDLIDYLLKLNLDFRCDRGNPLRLTSHFKLQAEAAAKRIIGSLPDFEAITQAIWKSEFQEDAEDFLRKKQFMPKRNVLTWSDVKFKSEK